MTQGEPRYRRALGLLLLSTQIHPEVKDLSNEFNHKDWLQEGDQCGSEYDALISFLSIPLDS